NQGVRYLISRDPQQLKPIPQLRERTMAALARAEAVALTEQEQALMDRTRTGLQSFFAEYDHMTEGNPDRADYLRTLDLVENRMPHDVLEPTHDYLRLNEGMLVRANEENRAVASRIAAGTLGLGLCGSLGGLLGGWVLSSALRRNLLRTEDRLRSTARQL